MRKLIFALLFTIGTQAQTFNFGCSRIDSEILPFYEMFISDAESHGFDLSSQTGIIKLVDTTGLFDRWSAWAGGTCKTRFNASEDQFNYQIRTWGEDVIVDFFVIINSSRWDYYEDEKQFRLRKFLVYHELAHDMLNLRHNCIRGDIMFSTSAVNCVTTGELSSDREDALNSDERFDFYANRMFGLIDQVLAECN